MNLDLAAIRKRCEAATGGPWKAKNVSASGWKIEARLHAWDNQLLAFFETIHHPSLKVEFSKDGLRLCAALGYETYCQFPSPQWPAELGANMNFIAHAREDVPALLAEVERLRAALDAIRDGITDGMRRLIPMPADTILSMIADALEVKP